MNAEQKIRSFAETWFLTEPVLFSTWTTHSIVKNNNIETLRVGGRKVEYNEKFVMGLPDDELKSLLLFEAFRILMKHPYERAKPNKIANYTGSNVTVQEYLSSMLEMPKALEMFDNLLEKHQSKHDKEFLEQYDNLEELDEDELKEATGLSPDKLRSIKAQIPSMSEEELDRRHFEFYYNLLDQHLPETMMDNPLFKTIQDKIQDMLDKKSEDGSGSPMPGGEGQGSQSGGSGSEETKEDGDGSGSGEEKEESKTTKDHFDPANAIEQSEKWGEDELLTNEINNVINNAQMSNSWGSIPGHMQQSLIASLKPKIDYKNILKSFKSSILSSDYKLTRMKPNRRSGWKTQGKKRDFTTRLAFFVDVSGSMSDASLQSGFSIINEFFSYGIPEIDVFQFDTELKSDIPVNMKTAQKEFKLLGRGGTDFQCIADQLLKGKTVYDGVIVYTDGYASAPKLPLKIKNKLLWLYDTELNYNGAKHYLEGCGRTAFVKSTDGY